jgi:hypothetical protein
MWKKKIVLMISLFLVVNGIWRSTRLPRSRVRTQNETYFLGVKDTFYGRFTGIRSNPERNILLGIKGSREFLFKSR